MEKSLKTSKKSGTVIGQVKPACFFDMAEKLLSSEPQRLQEIVKKRFGIGQVEPATLEKIGREYKITRERVRQIIADALRRIAARGHDRNFADAEELIILAIEKRHGIIEKNALVAELGKNDPRESNAILFFAATSKKVAFVEEKGKIRTSLSHSKEIVDFVRSFEQAAREVLEASRVPMSHVEIVDALQKVLAQNGKSASRESIESYLNVLDSVRQNKFGKWGRSHWKEISPKGTRERIHLILKEKNQPLHFTEIAELIDKHELGKKKAHPQTVHNELIKDDRFVLVGRGIYALTEWGYEKGTIKDVLEQILSKSGRPMTKDEIMKEALKVRKVKKTTVVINLNNPKIFVRKGDSYSLKK